LRGTHTDQLFGMGKAAVEELRERHRRELCGLCEQEATTPG
jgi:hypothetical protein